MIQQSLLDGAVEYSGWLIGAAGTGLAVIAERARRRSLRESQTISWEDIRLGIDDLVRQIRHAKRRGWKPDVVIASAPRGGIIAEMLIEALNPRATRVVGFVVPRSGRLTSPARSGFSLIDTPKWSVYLPEGPLNSISNATVLFIDDIVISGHLHRAVRDRLEILAGPSGEVITAALLASGVSVRSQLAPDFFSRERNEPVFYWPWGPSR